MNDPFHELYGMPDDKPPLELQIASVKREIALRRAVYPKRVASGKMHAATARLEIACMEAVLATLEQLYFKREP